MDKRQIILMTLTILSISILSCWSVNNKRKSEGSFYTNTGGWDWIRIPLIKPYEIKKIDPEIQTNNWGMSFEYEFKNHGASNIKQISIKNSIIYVYCGDSTLYNYQYIKEAWYIVIPYQKVERGFINKDNFRDYIRQNSYPKPQWLDVDSLSDVLAEEQRLPWFPQ